MASVQGDPLPTRQLGRLRAAGSKRVAMRLRSQRARYLELVSLKELVPRDGQHHVKRCEATKTEAYHSPARGTGRYAPVYRTVYRILARFDLRPMS